MAAPEEQGSNLPARRLSSHQLEEVIRRAVELQSSPGSVEEGVSEAEVLRIGRELGLPEPHLHQAIAEVRGRGAEEEHGVLTHMLGPSRVVAGRVVALAAADAARDLERYFTECEHMTVQRRRPGWSVYERGRSMSASVGRAFGDQRLVKARCVELSVEPVDERRCYLSLSADMAQGRAGFAAGALLGGGGGAMGVAAAFAIAIAPPAALLGLPVFAGSLWVMRAGYATLSERIGTRLESVLDRLESGELLPPSPSWRDTLKTLGL
ncbi:MAG: hypothetical protein M3409_07750 [Gemmatimonadota bacterium]|jgi:hypothetical protein|nr:hypothetical protein [Gemmatimonadota bacterium]